MLKRDFVAVFLVSLVFASCAAPSVNHGTADPGEDRVVLTVVFNPEIYPPLLWNQVSADGRVGQGRGRR